MDSDAVTELWCVGDELLNGLILEEPRNTTVLLRRPSSLLRRKSDPTLLPNTRSSLLRRLMVNFQEVLLGTKMCVLFPAILLAILAQVFCLGRPWIFALSLLGLAPLAERVSFLTEQIAHYTSSTVGGLLNATCGNATELIIAMLALHRGKITVLKYSLLGSILSNLLLVLGTSLLCGGLANLRKEQIFDKNQANINVLLLVLGLFCHLLPLLLQCATKYDTAAASSALPFSRASSMVMLVAYVAYIFFQLKTHQQVLKKEDVDGDNNEEEGEETAAIGFCSAVSWLVGMTMVISLLSEYVVGTIEAASSSWGISVGFLSIILIPIVGNAAEHAGAIIFAVRNKLDICFGIALGSATQISVFVTPFCVTIAWIIGVQMDLNLGALETGSFALSVLLVAFVVQDGTSHYIKGLVLLLSYVVISASFFVYEPPHVKP